jgi:hypothetical protein
VVGTNTARLTLYKPNPADTVDVNQDLNANMDKLDLLGKKAEPITNPFIKRNNADAVTSGTDLLFETLTVILKTNHWYEVQWSGQYNTSLAINTTPNSVMFIRIKAGGSVTTSDTQICKGTPPNINNSSPRFHMGTTFDVSADGTYTFGITANSGGGTNTLNLLASGGTDNTGISRCFWVKDLGEK